MDGVKDGMAYHPIIWDHKSGPSRDELSDALKPFGLYLYEDPTLKGSDCFAYLISDEPLTSVQVAEICSSYV